MKDFFSKLQADRVNLDRTSYVKGQNLQGNITNDPSSPKVFQSMVRLALHLFCGIS